MNKENNLPHSLTSFVKECKKGLLTHIIFSSISEAFNQYDLQHITGIKLERLSKLVSSRYSFSRKHVSKDELDILKPYIINYNKKYKDSPSHLYEELNEDDKSKLEAIVIRETKINIVKIKKTIINRLEQLHLWIQNQA